MAVWRACPHGRYHPDSIFRLNPNIDPSA